MQPSLFDSAAAEPAFSAAVMNWPTSYRLSGLSYIVTAHVDGVGTLTGRSHSLWHATCDVRSQITAALAARPASMF